MTQAIVDNFKILQNSVLSADNKTAGKFADAKTFDKNTSDFDAILDKTVKNTEKQTIGDIKGVDSNGDMSEQMKSFKDFLLQTTREVNMEKSLDLTLARDITEIIDQLKSAVDKALAAEDEEEVAEEILQPVFEQVLAFVNTNTAQIINESTGENTNESINLQNNENQNYKSSENEICKTLFKPKEILESDLTKNTDDNVLDLDREMLNELNIESMSAETDNSGSSYNLNQQSPEELSLKIMLNRDTENLNNGFEKIISNDSKPAAVTSENIVEQITKHIDSLKSTSKLNMVLNPESLGKVNLHILTTKDGLSAQFTVTTNEARDLLMKGLDGLKETLLAQGVAVDNISVKVSETEEAYNPDWTEQDSEGGNKEQGKEKQQEKEKGLFEKTIAQSLKEDNGNV